MTDTETHSQVS